jgi:hypothetical protein
MTPSEIIQIIGTVSAWTAANGTTISVGPHG